MFNVVITGANRGIGLEFVKHYLAHGHQVFALCRNCLLYTSPSPRDS